MKEEGSVSYLFSDEELKQLALHFRKYADCLPEALKPLSSFVESYVYANMTIGEVETFFENLCL